MAAIRMLQNPICSKTVAIPNCIMDQSAMQNSGWVSDVVNLVRWRMMIPMEVLGTLEMMVYDTHERLEVPHWNPKEEGRR
ncbi:unnamed protein product [Sphagnum compactum]